jgi:hypothetical protein
MTPEQQRKLIAISLRRTSYELAATRGERSYFICYSESRSRSAFWSCVSAPARAGALEWLTGATEITFGKRAADGGTLGDWRIHWTGRTKRQAIIEGELTFILDAVKEGKREGG